MCHHQILCRIYHLNTTFQPQHTTPPKKNAGAEATRAPDFWAGVGEDLQALQQQSPQHGLLTAIPPLPWAQALLYAALQGTFPPPSPPPTRAMLAGAMGGLQLPAPALEEVVLQLVADWVTGAESGQDSGVQRGLALLAAVPFSSARLAGEARLLEAAQVGGRLFVLTV